MIINKIKHNKTGTMPMIRFADRDSMEPMLKKLISNNNGKRVIEIKG